MLNACYVNKKNHHSKADSLFTIVTKIFLTYKNLYFVNDEVRTGCLKLGHTSLFFKHEQWTYYALTKQTVLLGPFRGCIKEAMCSNCMIKKYT